MGQNTSKTTSKQAFKQRVRENVWNRYVQEQHQGNAPNQTDRFFFSLPQATLFDFFGSKNRIVQFGVASGTFLKLPVFNARERVGYDYTDSSASLATFKHQHVDLDEHEHGMLAYQAQLEEDLSVPCDILLIRLLEYLDKEAATLLIASLIQTAKPGSVFYIELNKGVEQSPLTNDLDIGDLPSFFNHGSFEIKKHTVIDELGNAAEFGRTEQLIVSKSMTS